MELVFAGIAALAAIFGLCWTLYRDWDKVPPGARSRLRQVGRRVAGVFGRKAQKEPPQDQPEGVKEGEDGAESPPRIPKAIPTPVRHAVGRDEETVEICDCLRQSISLVVTGLPGIGKTTAVALGVRRLWESEDNPYTDLCFHRIVERDSLEERLGRLLVELLAELAPHTAVESEDLEARLGQLQRVLSGRRVLLVVDNADDPTSEEATQLVRQRLPVLTLAVTSRRGTWRDFHVLRLSGLPKEEGAKLFSSEFGPVVGKEHHVEALCDSTLR